MDDLEVVRTSTAPSQPTLSPTAAVDQLLQQVIQSQRAANVAQKKISNYWRSEQWRRPLIAFATYGNLSLHMKSAAGVFACDRLDFQGLSIRRRSKRTKRIDVFIDALIGRWIDFDPLLRRSLGNVCSDAAELVLAPSGDLYAMREVRLMRQQHMRIVTVHDARREVRLINVQLQGYLFEFVAHARPVEMGEDVAVEAMQNWLNRQRDLQNAPSSFEES